MKRAVLLDSSGWVAAAVRGQARHEEAKAAYTQAVRQGYRVIVTPMVLAESHALFLRLLGREKAAAALDGAVSDPTHVVFPVDGALVQAAVERWIRPYRDQRFSLCDAVSFEVMQREGITRALSIDRHFVTAGFDIVG
jgi:predicted nucleic acid-binding protein